MDVRTGQVWLYQRTDQEGIDPVVHVISKVDGDVVESTSVFTGDGTPHPRCVLSGRGCEGRGLKQMSDGKDSVGTWTVLYSPT